MAGSPGRAARAGEGTARRAADHPGGGGGRAAGGALDQASVGSTAMTREYRDPGAENTEAEWTFHRHVQMHPEVGDALRRRMQEYPEYRAWLEMLGGEVLPTLEGD